jgi:phage repressor protein C with HTH and peptisase S24 domain
MTFGDRLEALFEALKLKGTIRTKYEFCDLIKIDRRNLSKYLKGVFNFHINTSNYVFFKDNNVNLDWLLYGKGEMFLDKTKDIDVLLQENQDLKNQMTLLMPSNLSENGIREYKFASNEVVLTPIYQQKVSAGTGQELIITHDDLIIDYIPVYKQFLKDFIKNIIVSGDSMTEAHIFDGDVVFYHEKFVKGDGLYVIQVANELFVKRLIFDPFERKVHIISENKKMPENLRTKIVNAEDLIILGKVEGWFHRHPY